MEDVRGEIRRSTVFRFDWFFRSRTARELLRRAEALVRMIVKETEAPKPPRALPAAPVWYTKTATTAPNRQNRQLEPERIVRLIPDPRVAALVSPVPVVGHGNANKDDDGLCYVLVEDSDDDAEAQGAVNGDDDDRDAAGKRDAWLVVDDANGDDSGDGGRGGGDGTDAKRQKVVDPFF